VLPEGFAFPEVEFGEEDIPLRSIKALENPNIAEAVSVRILPQLVGCGEQYLEFLWNDDCQSSGLVGHCWLPTSTVANGHCENWEFQQCNLHTGLMRLSVPKALYWEYILPYYLIDFWHGLAVHLEYLDTANWWATYHL